MKHILMILRKKQKKRMGKLLVMKKIKFLIKRRIKKLKSNFLKKNKKWKKLNKNIQT